jgi:hypothetical protein
VGDADVTLRPRRTGRTLLLTNSAGDAEFRSSTRENPTITHIHLCSLRSLVFDARIELWIEGEINGGARRVVETPAEGHRWASAPVPDSAFRR